MVAESDIQPGDLIAPVFVDATTSEPVEIPSMPGQIRFPVDDVVKRVKELEEIGVGGIILFGIPESKDDRGTRAWAENGVIQRSLRKIASQTELTTITDVCLCEYTSHGHCGVLEETATTDPTQTVKNDETLDLIARTAVSHAEAGADMVAPSGMMDGMVRAIRQGLDSAEYESLPILSYAVKYESSFYGPFRDAADGAPSFGDRRHYQMNPANLREARREAELDVEQGADALMVKPGLPYLDVIRDLRTSLNQPLVAYNVSGEYAMLHAAADRGWLNLEETALESLISMKRAGADAIISYFADDIADRL
ncbi:MAG: porphobilinogen synthase [Halobacteriaceae archaeon]